MGLQGGYSQEQWGPWKSHSLLLQQAIEELTWQGNAQALISCFKDHSKTKEGYLNKEEFIAVFQKYPCSKPLYHAAFFELFDRNQDGFINEMDFLGGILAISPSTPHVLETPSGQLRMQFIFLYYDTNRNGRLEVDELAKMIEHISMLRGRSHPDAKVDANALISLFSGPFGFAAFYDAAQKCVLNGTSPLLRTIQDLSEVVIEASQKVPVRPQVSKPSVGGPMPSSQTAPQRNDEPRDFNQAKASVEVAPSNPSISSTPYPLPGVTCTHVSQSNGASTLALRIVRRLMELSNSPRTDWRYALQLATYSEMLLLCDTVVERFRDEDSLVQVPLPCRVYGDIHGQLLDLLEFFNAFSWPDKRRGDIFSMNYVFLGDFVDRGNYSCDVIALLFSLKILYPTKVFLVRGNHEDRLMNLNYGFHADCIRKFGQDGEDFWERANDAFEFLPIAALVDDTILCIHGGIGDSIHLLDDLRGIPKPIQIVGEINANTTARDRMILDALWSDPTDNDSVLGVHSSPRGKNTCRYGPDRVQEFNHRNGLKLIIRAHECVQHGYEYFAHGQLLTVFSATNYCNQYNNDGAMIVLVKDDRTGEVVEHAQVIKSGTVDTSQGWNEQQFRAPSPMRRNAESFAPDWN